MRRRFPLSLTTQGPLYPPSEVMDQHGNFVVIGALNRSDDTACVRTEWGQAIVAADSVLPPFGQRAPYRILEEFSLPVPEHLADLVLHTLPLPLPCANYPMVFAPEQYPDANAEVRPSYPFHETPIPDIEPSHGRRLTRPITLADWVTAQGELTVTLADDARSAEFDFTFSGLLSDSLYTIMSLHEHDLNPQAPTRPSPLGVPNVFVTDAAGQGRYRVDIPDPFPNPSRPGANRIINAVVLWMSYQLSNGGAIGRYGLGGDIHAQLKLQTPSFQEFETRA